MNRNLKRASVFWSALLLVSLLLSLPLAWASGLDSLRGAKPLDAGDLPATVHRFQEGGSFDRNYVQQPPLVPHEVETYQIDLRTNRCLSCHSWANHRREQSPKVSRSHFKDRDGNDQSNVSARYYFCDSCHVPQADARPLVENQFVPLGTLRSN